MSKNELRSSGERRRRAFVNGAGELLAVNYCFTACSSASTRGSSSGTGPSCPGSLCTSVPVCRGRAGNSSKMSLLRCSRPRFLTASVQPSGRPFYAMLRLFHRKISHSDPPRGCTGTIPPPAPAYSVPPAGSGVRKSVKEADTAADYVNAESCPAPTDKREHPT